MSAASPRFTLSKDGITSFRKLMYSAYETEGRSFPWRETTDAWGILVSEVMLQQTQTARVVSYWTMWMQKWSSPAALHEASLEDVLKQWSGLGYNRRARSLKDAARIITLERGGNVPETADDLIQLPGIGAYTSKAVACFAYNHPSVFIETNIRAVMLELFFTGQDGISDREIMPVLEAVLDKDDPRTWYWALMDYGASLKRRSGAKANPNRLSAHYTRQSAFKGSFRQIRGSIIRNLALKGGLNGKDLYSASCTEGDLKRDTPVKESDFYRALESLRNESMVAESGGVYRISDR